MRYCDLPTSPPIGVCLRCRWCQANFSAARGDYFTHAGHETVFCGECAKQLVEIRTSYVRWRAPVGPLVQRARDATNNKKAG